ncbi:MAG TPA: nitrilase-related carbon-nitrogen hydrolase, partial [Negativicutes bacterium]|nr:nitrilase-related carbon-nitrogen hydrolase [Negativicutes bacterium]
MSVILTKWFSLRLGTAGRQDHAPMPGIVKREGFAGSIIKAAAVQRRISVTGSISAYENMTEAFVRKAAEQKCDIIAFPEYNFLDLLGLIPGLGLLDSRMNRKAAEGNGKGGHEGLERLYAMLYSISEPIQSAIEGIMCGLARKYGMYIYTGSYFIREKDLLYNGGAIISREGNILGRQLKLHLTGFEEKLGVSRCSRLEVFSLDIGNVAFPVCMDATYYEVFKIAESRGCDIVILPIANNEEYSFYRALRGIWPRVQESHLYGIKPALTGWLLGMHFTGKAGIFAPMGITANGDGIVAISENSEGDSLVIGEIDLKALY